MITQERRLYAKCVKLMVRDVEDLLDHKPGTLIRNGLEVPLPAPYFYHYHQSDLEEYAGLLESLGFLIPLVDPPGRACNFKLTCTSTKAGEIA